MTPIMFTQTAANDVEALNSSEFRAIFIFS